MARGRVGWRVGTALEPGAEGRGRLLGNFPGAEERSLEGGGAFQSATFCRGWLHVARTNRAQRLVIPSWQPTAPPELLPAIMDSQEGSRVLSPRRVANSLSRSWDANKQRKLFILQFVPQRR